MKDQRTSIRSQGWTLTGLLAWTAAMALLGGCIPEDDRPDPGLMHVVAAPSQGITAGVSTADGWHISFEKFLIQLGVTPISAPDLGEPGAPANTCISYSETQYERLLAVTAPGRQKVADMYGLGSCVLAYHLGRPSSESVLGAGLTPADLTFMQTPGPDLFHFMHDGFSDEDGLTPSRNVYLRGQATRGATTKSFDWGFDASGQTSCVVALQGKGVTEFTIVVRGEELFRESSTAGAALRFNAMADADLDGDQRISMAELMKAPGPAQPGPLQESTLAELVYWLVLDQLVAPADCVPFLP